ncbi:hypothetical protein HS088_TW14G00882 [Tripterygium wilfordii]|uniref:Embryo sac development arrest 6 n=1 Tax=Tripterygium wilfordii TaxID=458696 RepID=A0A7J7CRL6_TRIWF|nr:uncharacterized protein LOC120014635 [Tripterygium wilfordii]KAF5736730.1 hypothetical protein HS088_TW14G00882 [Tripterygium wilfordii]
MSHHPRRIVPPGLSKKRKERESPSFPIKPSAAVPARPAASKAVEPICSNRLLAGYMAYEFLTKGTLFGKKFVVPARAGAVAVRSSSSAELKRVKREAELVGGEKQEERSYDEVASIVKSDGVHIPGIVNPTQLARWTRAS